MPEIPDVEKDPSIGVSYNMQLGAGHSLVLQTFVARDGDAALINGVLDKLRVAADRQWAFAERERYRAKLSEEEQQAAAHAIRMAQVDENIKIAWNGSGKRGDVKLTAKEIQDQKQAYSNAEIIQKNIAAWKERIAQLDALIGA